MIINLKEEIEKRKQENIKRLNELNYELKFAIHKILNKYDIQSPDLYILNAVLDDFVLNIAGEENSLNTLKVIGSIIKEMENLEGNRMI
jgi:hypothetical protein